MQKLEWFGYQAVEKSLRIRLLVLTELIHKHVGRRDGQADGRTDRHRKTAQAALIHSIARQKLNHKPKQSAIYQVRAAHLNCAAMCAETNSATSCTSMYRRTANLAVVILFLLKRETTLVKLPYTHYAAFHKNNPSSLSPPPPASVSLFVRKLAHVNVDK